MSNNNHNHNLQHHNDGKYHSIASSTTNSNSNRNSTNRSHINNYQNQQSQPSSLLSSSFTSTTAGTNRHTNLSETTTTIGTIPRKNRPLPKIPKKKLKPIMTTSSNSNTTSFASTPANYGPTPSMIYSSTKNNTTSTNPSNNTSHHPNLNPNHIEIKNHSPLIMSIHTKYLPKPYDTLSKQSLYSSTSFSAYTSPPPSSSSSKRRTSSSLSPTLRSSNRSKIRKTYVDETNDDDFLELQDSEDENDPVHEHEYKNIKKKNCSHTHNKDGDDEEEEYEFQDNEHDNHYVKPPPLKKRHISKSSLKSNTSTSSSTINNNVYTKSSTATHTTYTNYNLNDTNHSSNDNTIPNDVLPSLWYSNEIFINEWVIEKIIGWKTRSKVTLVPIVHSTSSSSNTTAATANAMSSDDHENEKNEIFVMSTESTSPKPLQPPPSETTTPNTNANHNVESFNENAKIISDKLIYHYNPTNHQKRMDISRINPMKCPVVIKAFVDKERRRVERENKGTMHEDKGLNDTRGMDKDGDSIMNDPTHTINNHNLPPYELNINQDDKEEVLLIKWRGKSYLHCSWERPDDLEIFDTSGNNSAKGKIKRYYQSQHMVFGKDWKRVLEENRRGRSTGGDGNNDDDDDDGKGMNNESNGDGGNVDLDRADEEEEHYFQPDYMEVERIMACDENQMDMSVLSRQRALNMKTDLEEENRRHKELMGENDIHDDDDTSFQDEEKPWDTEDNVRYVVKWKGLQTSEITWEYWLYLKQDSVDQAEDFWHRQKAPDPDVIKQSMKSHPTMRDYKKLTESPIFGTISKQRPIGTLEDKMECTPQKNDDGDGLKLRTYQLEGVNWLLWNWWNKRSCILADEMVSSIYLIFL